MIFGEYLIIKESISSLEGKVIMETNNYTKDLGPDETIPIWFDKLFKLVFANKDHLERTKFLISSALDLEIDNIELINSEIIEDNRMNLVKKKSY